MARSTDPAAAAPKADEGPPNVVLLLSDDQTLEEMRFMPKVRSLIGDRGATFPTAVTNWPLCCPARATLQTGQYAHNHGVLGNKPPIGGFGQLNLDETLPVWLQRSGYYTAHIGKFLNGYEDSDVGVPPGWSEWHGSKTTYTYYGYKLFEDGQINTYGTNQENPDAPAQPETYSTDVYTDKAVDVINQRAPSDQPFFLSVAYLAPHGGGPNSGQYEENGRCDSTAKPAARHIGAFGTTPLPQPPNFDEADVTDKPAGIAGRAPLSQREIRNATRNYRCRAESLLALDEGAERVINALKASGELDNTLVIYTSDNGFFHGEHRIANGKNRVYEEAIRVPLLMRGPDIPKGVTVDDISINADLPPTILDAAGAKAGTGPGRPIAASLRRGSRASSRSRAADRTGITRRRGRRTDRGRVLRGPNLEIQVRRERDRRDRALRPRGRPLRADQSARQRALRRGGSGARGAPRGPADLRRQDLSQQARPEHEAAETEAAGEGQAPMHPGGRLCGQGAEQGTEPSDRGRVRRRWRERRRGPVGPIRARNPCADASRRAQARGHRGCPARRRTHPHPPRRHPHLPLAGIVRRSDGRPPDTRRPWP